VTRPSSTSFNPASPEPRRGEGGWDVLGLGANSIDFVHLLPAFPQPEGWLSKMRVSRHFVAPGGQTATTLAACARFGLRAKYLGATGTDENGARVRAELPRRQVDASDVAVREANNQYAVILIEEHSGERVVLWDRDERLELAEGDVPLALIASARLLHVDDVDQAAAIRAARHARSLGIPVTSDLDRMTERTSELVAAVTVPIFAEGLLPQLTGAEDPEEGLRALRRVHDGLLVVTRGHLGAMALDGDRLIDSPGFKVNVRDTTGSGDIFRAGFIYAWLNGWPVDRVLRFANAAAALSCTRFGAMDGIPDLEEALELEGRGCTRSERRV
jgi:sugar/nucleoside kinase (ribokinase family)